MTTIVAIQNEEGATIASDTQVTDGTGRILETIKIVENGSFLVSGAGDCFPLDLLQYMWKSPKPTMEDRKDLFKFMVTKVVPSLRKCLKENDWTKPEKGSYDGFDGIFAVAGHVFNVGDDFSTLIPRNNVLAAGSGGAYALGAIHSGATIEQAMEIAAENDSNTSAPFVYFTQKK